MTFENKTIKIKKIDASNFLLIYKRNENLIF